MNYYLPILDRERRIRYYENFKSCDVSPDWLIVNSLNNESVIQWKESGVATYYSSGKISGIGFWLINQPV